MKFLIVLALAVVATQAAFTGSLVQQAQPLLQGLKLQSLAKNSVEANFQTQLGEAISQQVTNVFNQIDSAVSHVQNVAQTFSHAVLNAVQQAGAIGQQAVQQAQSLFINLLSNLSGLLSNNRALPDELVALIQQAAASPFFPAVLNVVHNTQLYQCLTEKGLGIEYNHLAELYYSDALLAAAVAARPEIKECVEEQGLDAIHDVVRPYVPLIQGALAHLQIEEIVHNAVIGIIGQDLYDIYVAPVLSNKGLIGNVVGGIQNGAAQLGQFIAGVAQSAIVTLKEKIEKLKELATIFVQNGLQNAQQLTLQAAQNLVAALQLIKDDLGLVYNQMIDQLSAIHTSLVLPF